VLHDAKGVQIVIEASDKPYGPVTMSLEPIEATLSSVKMLFNPRKVACADPG